MSLEYKIQRIDSVYQKELFVAKNSGTALLEKNENDKVFGFSFYGKRNDVPMEYIYDAGNGFEISKEQKTYQVYPGSYGFLGSPGGQMVHPNIFKLDSIYKNISVSEIENSYLLSFEFENDTLYNVSDRIMVYELNRTDFFPIEIKQTSNQLGNKSVSIAKFSDVKINENVTNSIEDLKQDFQNYSIIQPKKKSQINYLQKNYLLWNYLIYSIKIKL